MKPPYVITRKGEAATAAKRWAVQYRINLPHAHALVDPSKLAAHERLLKLGPNPSPEDVERIVDNTTWTEVKCDQCKGSFEEAVVVGGQFDQATLCRECLKRALGMLESE